MLTFRDGSDLASTVSAVGPCSSHCAVAYPCFSKSAQRGPLPPKPKQDRRNNENQRPKYPEGQVKKLVPGAVNTEVTVELPGATEVVSIITKESADHLKLAMREKVAAVVKASDGMIAVD